MPNAARATVYLCFPDDNPAQPGHAWAACDDCANDMVNLDAALIADTPKPRGISICTNPRCDYGDAPCVTHEIARCTIC